MHISAIEIGFLDPGSSEEKFSYYTAVFCSVKQSRFYRALIKLYMLFFYSNC